MLETLASHLDAIAAFAPVWGLLFVFVFMTIESSFIPFPSEVVMIPAGFLASRGEFTGGDPTVALWLAIAAGTAGSLAGAYVNYYLAAWVGKPFLEKYGKYFFVKKSHVDIAQEWFDKYGIKAVFFSRMLPVVRTFISLPAGFAHVDMKKFFFYTFIGSLPWTALILFIGMMLGEGWKVMMEVGHEISLAVAAVIVIICIVLYVQYRRKKKKRVH